MIWNWLKDNNQTLLGIVALLITLIYGYWGVSLSEKQVELSKKQIELSEAQNATSIDLLHFSQLLIKTDTVITLSTRQLILNEKVQARGNTIYENSEIGNMNRLTEKIQLINFEFSTITGGNYVGKILSEDSLRVLNSKLLFLKNLFVSEMDNPYVNSNDTIYKLWSLAYSNIVNLNFVIELEFSNIGIEIFNGITNKGEIKKVDYVEMQMSFNEGMVIYLHR